MTFNLDCCNYNEVQDPRKVNSIAACALNDLARVSGASEVKWENCGALLFAPLAVMNTDRDKRDCVRIFIFISKRARKQTAIQYFIAVIHINRCKSMCAEFLTGADNHAATRRCLNCPADFLYKASLLSSVSKRFQYRTDSIHHVYRKNQFWSMEKHVWKRERFFVQ